MKKALVSVAIFIVALALLARAGLLSSLFSSNYVAHRFCYLAQPGLVWTNVIMDGLIGVSYAVIFVSLFWIANRLRGVPALRGYLWIFISFGTFIVACGATHLMEIVTIWIPVYPLSATVKVICAAASVPTAILFAMAAPALAANMRRFLEMLSATRHEKEQAVMALMASEKLAVAGRISASIAHEIKNPLDTVNGLLYLVRQDQRVPADLFATLDAATGELERANRIAQSTLSLYRESSEPVPVSLAEVVDSVLNLQSADLKLHHVTLERRLRTPIPLKAYSGEMRQVLINLIQNAAAAMSTGGRILVRVQPRHFIDGRTKSARSHRLDKNPDPGHFGLPGYSITVADTGSGIDPANRPRLFTLFFSTKGEQGTGLGLWLVRSMVEKQGGRIVFRSRTAQECESHGTIFNIWVPLEPTKVSSPGLSSGVVSPAHVVEMMTGGLSSR